MRSSQSKLSTTTYFLTLLGVTLPLVSIFLSQTFLAVAILTFSWECVTSRGSRIYFPPIKLPLILFMAATFVALVFSPEPGFGRAAINKFWLFVIILLVVNLFTFERIRQTYQVMFILGVLASLLVVGQFLIVWWNSIDNK